MFTLQALLELAKKIGIGKGYFSMLRLSPFKGGGGITQVEML